MCDKKVSSSRNFLKFCKNLSPKNCLMLTVGLKKKLCVKNHCDCFEDCLDSSRKKLFFPCFIFSCTLNLDRETERLAMPETVRLKGWIAESLIER